MMLSFSLNDGLSIEISNSTRRQIIYKCANMFSTTDIEKKKQKLHDKNPYEIGTSCRPPSLLGNSFHRNTLVTTFVCLLPFLKRHHLRLPFMNNINVLLGFEADGSSVEDMVTIWLGKDISYGLCSF